MAKSPDRIKAMYLDKDTLSIRRALHTRYSVNPYGWDNWVFDQYQFPHEGRVLELGCGTGQIWAGRAVPGGGQVILSDFSPLMVRKASALLGDAPGFCFEQADIQAIPHEDAAFDAVIANHMLYHVPDINGALAEVARVLKPGGTLYATTTGEHSLGELQSLYRAFENRVNFSFSGEISFTLENGRAQLEKHFSPVEVRQYFDALEVTSEDDLLSYIQSYNSIPGDALPDFRAELSRGFSPNGVFHIRKDQGMFICRKP